MANELFIYLHSKFSASCVRYRMGGLAFHVIPSILLPLDSRWINRRPQLKFNSVQRAPKTRLPSQINSTRSSPIRPLRWRVRLNLARSSADFSCATQKCSRANSNENPSTSTAGPLFLALWQPIGRADFRQQHELPIRSDAKAIAHG